MFIHPVTFNLDKKYADNAIGFRDIFLKFSKKQTV